MAGEEGFEPPSCYKWIKRYTPSSKWSKFLQQRRLDRTVRLPIPPLPSDNNFKDKMVEAEGVEPSSTVAKNGVIHRLSWFVIVIPTKLGSYNLSLTALLQ